MIHRLVRSEAALPPVEVNVFVSADQSGHPPQFFVAEIFCLQAVLAIRRSDKFGLIEYLFERRNVNRVQNLSSRSETVAYTFPNADVVEWLVLGAAFFAAHCRIVISPNHSDGSHLTLVQ